jgi:hypothetical protein
VRHALMFWDDHNPPHFHARYSDSQALVSISDLQIIQANSLVELSVFC